MLKGRLLKCSLTCAPVSSTEHVLFLSGKPDGGHARRAPVAPMCSICFLLVLHGLGAMAQVRPEVAQHRFAQPRHQKNRLFSFFCMLPFPSKSVHVTSHATASAWSVIRFCPRKLFAWGKKDCILCTFVTTLISGIFCARCWDHQLWLLTPLPNHLCHSSLGHRGPWPSPGCMVSVSPHRLPTSLIFDN